MIMSKLSRGLKKLTHKVWTARQQWMLPLVLIVIFMIQTQVFNLWLNIKVTPLQQRLVSSFCVAMLAFGPAMVLRRRARYIWLTVAAFLLELLFVAQFIYFLSFDTFLRGSALRYVTYVGAVSDSIKVQINPLLLFFAVMLPVIGLWYWFIDRKKPQPVYRRKTRLIALAGILLIIAASFLMVLSIERKKHGGLRELLNVPYDNSTMVTKVGVHMYSILDTYRYFASPRGITEVDKRYIQDWAKNRPAPQAPGANFGVAKGRNVIGVQLESYESFVIGRSIQGQEITPNLNKLVKQSAYYPNYHDQVSTGRTADGEFETWNSLLPTMDRVAFFEYPTHDYNALPDLLRDAGYNTSVFHGDAATFWNRNVAYPYLGWDKYYDITSFKINKPIGWGLSDQELVEQSMPYIKKLPQPFFAQLGMLTSHTPFDIPKEEQQLTIEGTEGLTQFQINYIQSLAYVDKQVGLLIDELKAAGLYDNSIIALYGDHRAFMSNENDKGFAEFRGLEKFDQMSFFTTGENVPLIVHVPGTDINVTDTTPAGHLDYAPTILGLLGMEAPRTMLGQDLLSPRKPVAIQRNSAGSVEIIETPEVFYANPGDGDFSSGKCFNTSTKQQIELSACKAVYDEQSALAKVSDLVVRGDALNLLK